MHTKHLPFPNLQLHTNRTRLTCTLVCFRRYRSSFKVKESNEIVRPTWFFYVLISSQKKMCLEVKASKLLCVPTPALEPRASTGLASGSSPATWSTMEKSPERKKTKQPCECCCKNMLWNAFTLILYIYSVEMFRKPVVLKTSRLFGPTFSKKYHVSDTQLLSCLNNHFMIPQCHRQLYNIIEHISKLKIYKVCIPCDICRVQCTHIHYLPRSILQMKNNYSIIL